MKKFKLNLQNIEGAQVLTREQLKKIMGGDETTVQNEMVYNCTCTSNGITGSWNVTAPSTNGTTPPQETIDSDISANCSAEGGSTPSADCSWKTCGNPGVSC